MRLDLAPAEAMRSGCVLVDGDIVVRVSDDCDGDRSPFEEDCDDRDAEIIGDTDDDGFFCQADCDIGPFNAEGKPEVCDGTDDDCDPSTEPPVRYCADVVFDGEQVVSCGLGERLCDDRAPGGQYGECNVVADVDPTTSADLCARWAQCSDGDPSCFVDAKLSCGLPVDGGTGEVCLPAITELSGFAPAGCVGWRVVGGNQSGPWSVGVRPAGTDLPPGDVVPTCDAELVVDNSDPVSHVFVLVVDGANGPLVRYAVVVSPSEQDCDPNGGGATMECHEGAFP